MIKNYEMVSNDSPVSSQKTIQSWKLFFSLFIVLLTGNYYAQTYCTPSYTYGCDDDDAISQVILNGVNQSINNTTQCGGSNGYSDYTSMSADLMPGMTYTIQLSTAYMFPEDEDARAWIDYNQDGIFDASEEIANTNGNGFGYGLSSFTFTVPTTALPGTTRMRVKLEYTGGGFIDPCSSALWGETEDYSIDILALSTCTGQPTATLVSTNTSVCSNDPFSVVGQAIQSGGITYQWQSSPAGTNTWTNITGATLPTYNATAGITSDTDYRLIVSCTASSLSDTSSVVTYTLKPANQCYCVPVPPSFGCSGDNITSVGLETLNDNGLTCTPIFEDRSTSQNAIPNLTEGLGYSMSVGVGTGGNEYVGVWIDFNQNGIYESSEFYLLGNGNGTTITNTITIPYGVTAGVTKMRVRSKYSTPPFDGSDACNSVNYGTTRDYEVNLIAATPCSGTPTATLISTSSSVCANIAFTLSADAIAASGITYQWQSSPAGANTWTDISGATSYDYIVTGGISSATDYRVIIECNGTNPATSAPITMTITPANQCYCTPSSTGAYFINDFTTMNGSTNINNTNSGNSSNGYGDFSATQTVTVLEGNSFDFLANFSPSTSTFGFRVWIDFNQDGNFDPLTEVAYQSTSYQSSQSGTINIPVGTMTGTTKMRIANHWLSATGDVDPCTTVFTYGEFEDYSIEVIGLTPCSGTPTANLISTSGGVCAGVPFTLEVDQITSGGITYQWQQSDAGQNNWVDLGPESATSFNYTLTSGITTPQDFRVIVTCNGTDSQTSSVISYTINPANICYCIPTTTGGATYYISNFETTGAITNINNASGSSATGYEDFSATVQGSVLEGNTVNYSMTVAGGSTYGQAIWIDWNEDGQFDATEQVVSSSTYVASPLAGSFMIPLGTTPGVKRMRILTSFTPANPSDPCANGGSGEYEDYSLEVIGLTPCSGTPTANLNSTSGGVCAGVPFTLEVDQIASGGITYQWQQSDAGQNNWVDLGPESATSFNYTLTSGITTPQDFRVIVTCNGTDSQTSSVISYTINPANTCYCIPSSTNSSYFINDFTTTNGSTNINNTGTGYSANGYGDFSATQTVTILEGNSFDFLANFTPGSNTFGFRVWIDFNQDGIFDPTSEVVYQSTAYQNSQTGTINIPIGTTTGTTRMRIANHYLNSSGNVDPCITGFTYGEFEDYSIEIVGLTPCTGTPDANLISTSGAVCLGDPLTLEGEAVQAGNITYQWEQSDPGMNNWYNVPGANSYTYTFTSGISDAKDYRLVVTCTASNQTTYSSTLEYTIKPAEQCYCTPHYDDVFTYINGVTTTGGIVDINNASNGAFTGGYADYYDTDSLVLQVGGSATLEYELVTSSAGVAIFVDMNNDGQFTPGTMEELYSSNSYLNSGTYQLQIDIPVGTLPGTYRARIVADWLSMNPSPCPDNDEGEAEDYKIVILPQCTDPIVDLGPANVILCGPETLLLDAGNPGLTYNWSTGETTQTITVNSTGTYTVTVNDQQCSTTASVNVTVNPIPQVSVTVSDLIICAGETSTLTATGADDYVWLDDNSTGATHTVTPTQTTTYTVEGTTDGCSSTATASVIIKDNADCETGVKDIQAINLNIYPNPANTNVTVNGFDLTQYFSEYSIVDLTGRTISTQKVNSDELSIDVSKLVEGVYFINLNGTFHKAIMIEVKH